MSQFAAIKTNNVSEQKRYCQFSRPIFSAPSARVKKNGSGPARLDNPLFDCSASNNSYYGWAIDQSVSNELFSVSVTFNTDHPFQSIKVSVIFLVSTASSVSVPTEIVYAGFLSSQFVSQVSDYPPANLPEGPYQYNYTLSPGGELNQVIIDIYPNTTFQWVAINRIIFCPATTEGLCPHTLDHIIVCVPVAVVVVWGVHTVSIDHL